MARTLTGLISKDSRGVQCKMPPLVARAAFCCCLDVCFMLLSRGPSILGRDMHYTLSACLSVCLSVLPRACP